MKTTLTALVVLISSTILYSQSTEKAQKEAMDNLNWLVGEWKGTSIVQMGPTYTDTILMHETISKELDGTIIKISGIG